jgi:hypothetical protein
MTSHGTGDARPAETAAPGAAPSGEPTREPSPGEPVREERTPPGVLLWFAWAFVLLAMTGLLLPQIIEFVDFSANAPFSLLGIFMMLELALVIFGVTVALQRKKIGWRFAIGISLLPIPILAGLPPALFHFPQEAASGWYGIFVPVGLILSVLLTVLLLRPAARAYFSED